MSRGMTYSLYYPSINPGTSCLAVSILLLPAGLPRSWFFFCWCYYEFNGILSYWLCHYYYYFPLIYYGLCTLSYCTTMLLLLEPYIRPHTPSYQNECWQYFQIPNVHIYLVHPFWICDWCIIFIFTSTLFLALIHVYTIPTTIMYYDWNSLLSSALTLYIIICLAMSKSRPLKLFRDTLVKYLHNTYSNLYSSSIGSSIY